MSGYGRLCCKSPKLPGDKFPAVRRSDRRPPICVVSITLPRSPVSLSSGDEVPHIFTRKSRLQPGKILTTGAKRLLQHNLPEADSCTAAKTGATCDDLFDHIVSPLQRQPAAAASGIASPSDLTMVRLMMRSNLVCCRDLLRKQRAPEDAAVRWRKSELSCQKPGRQRLEFIERTDV